MSTNFYLQKILTEEEMNTAASAVRHCPHYYSSVIEAIDGALGFEEVGACGDTTHRIHLGKRVEDRFIFARSLEDHMKIQDHFLDNLSTFMGFSWVIFDESGNLAYSSFDSFVLEELKGTFGRYDARYEDLLEDKYCFTKHKTWFI